MGRAAFPPGSFWGESVSLLIEVADKIQEHLVVGLRCQFPCWLLAGPRLAPEDVSLVLIQSYISASNGMMDPSYAAASLTTLSSLLTPLFRTYVVQIVSPHAQDNADNVRSSLNLYEYNPSHIWEVSCIM